MSDLRGALLRLPALALVASMTVAAILWLVAPWFDNASATGYALPLYCCRCSCWNRFDAMSHKGFAKPLGSVMPDELLRPVLLVSVHLAC